MNLFTLFASIQLDTSQYENSVNEVVNSGQSLGDRLKSSLSTAGSIAAKGIGLITGAATAAGGALLALEASTEEYRAAQGKLNTAFETAGFSAETANQAYTNFYGILGDTDTATEASQLLAELALSSEDVSKWTDIAAGVYGRFGDSIETAGFIEAINQSQKLGEVNGTLADALEFAGITTDEFNERLSQCSTEAERNQLIMNTLNHLYGEASDAFYKNNEALVKSRENQAKMQESMAKIGEAVTNVKNAFLENFTPVIADAAEQIAEFVQGIDGEQLVNSINNIINTFQTLLPIITGVTAAFYAYKAALAISQVIDAVRAATEGVTIAQAALNVVMNANPFVLVATAIAAVVTALLTLWATNEDFRNAVTEIWNNIVDLFTGAWEWIKNAWNAAPEFFGGIWDSIQNAFKSVDTFMSEKFGSAWELIKLQWSVVGGYFKQIWETIKGVFSVVKDVLTGDFQGAWDGIKGIVDGWIDYFKGIWDGIKDVFSGVIDYFIGIGENIVNGIWQGIKNMANWLKQQVQGFFSGIVDGAKSVLGIHSPSKVFAEIGQYSAEGVGVGWSSKFSGIKKQIDSDLDFGMQSVSFDNSGVGALSRSMAGVQSRNESGKIYIDLTTTLDGAILSKKMYNYNKSEVMRRGASFA